MGSGHADWLLTGGWPSTKNTLSTDEKQKWLLEVVIASVRTTQGAGMAFRGAGMAFRGAGMAFGGAGMAFRGAGMAQW